MKHNSSRQIFKKYSNITVHKISPVGAELFSAGGLTDKRRTDMTKLTVAFLQFCERT